MNHRDAQEVLDAETSLHADALSRLVSHTEADHEAAKHTRVKAIACPPGFGEFPPSTPGMLFGGRAFLGRGLKVLVSVDVVDGAEWFHLSVSRRSRTPSYEDIAWVRDCFIDPDRPAYHVFPRKAEHVNYHPNCLHLWQPLGRDPFPDPLGERMRTIGP